MGRLSRRQLLRASVIGSSLGPLVGCGVIAPMPRRAVARVGFLSPFDEASSADQVRVLLDGFRELGHTPGKDLLLEQRLAVSRLDRLVGLAQELRALPVDVILAQGIQAARASVRADPNLPVVAVLPLVADPVKEGLVANLAHPGGQLTGLIGAVPELWGKRLQLLKDAVPPIARVAVLWPPGGPGVDFGELASQAPALGLDVRNYEVGGAQEIDPAFGAAAQWGADGLLTTSTLGITTDAARLPGLALDHHLPAISDADTFVHNGGLLAYLANVLDLDRRATVLVDKILKGASPRDIPIERPTRFDLLLNLQTAHGLDLAIPDSFLKQVTGTVP
jgi:putative ABC transport system substrate-binding protein